MKRRLGLVSNSSSSSFVCDLTGVSYEGYEGEYDVDVLMCEQGHSFAYSRGEFPELDTWVSENGLYDELPEDVCPICNGTAKPQLADRIKSLMRSYNITVDDLK